MRLLACTSIVLGIALLAGCGGHSGRGSDSNAVAISGEVIEGGQMGWTTVLVEASDGRVYMIESTTIGAELRNLIGMRVAIRGSIVGEMEGVPRILLNWYELLPLPSGERPIVGWVREGGFILADDDVIWKLEGDFGDVLASFAGSKVWVVGIVMQRVNTSQGAYRVLNVTDYGVISP